MPFPEQRDILRELVTKHHTKIKGEPLLLAIYYRSAKHPQKECVFEVSQNFGFNEVSDYREIMQVEFGGVSGFPLPYGHYLRLFLTNPVEMQTALEQNWQPIDDLRLAISEGAYEILYQNKGKYDSTAIHLLAALQKSGVATR